MGPSITAIPVSASRFHNPGSSTTQTRRPTHTLDSSIPYFSCIEDVLAYCKLPVTRTHSISAQLQALIKKVNSPDGQVISAAQLNQAKITLNYLEKHAVRYVLYTSQCSELKKAYKRELDKHTKNFEQHTLFTMQLAPSVESGSERNPSQRKRRVSVVPAKLNALETFIKDNLQDLANTKRTNSADLIKDLIAHLEAQIKTETVTCQLLYVVKTVIESAQNDPSNQIEVQDLITRYREAHQISQKQTTDLTPLFEPQKARDGYREAMFKQKEIKIDQREVTAAQKQLKNRNRFLFVELWYRLRNLILRPAETSVNHPNSSTAPSEAGSAAGNLALFSSILSVVILGVYAFSRGSKRLSDRILAKIDGIRATISLSQFTLRLISGVGSALLIVTGVGLVVELLKNAYEVYVNLKANYSSRKRIDHIHKAFNLNSSPPKTTRLGSVGKGLFILTGAYLIQSLVKNIAALYPKRSQSGDETNTRSRTSSNASIASTKIEEIGKDEIQKQKDRLVKHTKLALESRAKRSEKKAKAYSLIVTGCACLVAGFFTAGVAWIPGIVLLVVGTSKRMGIALEDYLKVRRIQHILKLHTELKEAEMTVEGMRAQIDKTFSYLMPEKDNNFFFLKRFRNPNSIFRKINRYTGHLIYNRVMPKTVVTSDILNSLYKQWEQIKVNNSPDQFYDFYQEFIYRVRSEMGVIGETIVQNQQEGFQHYFMINPRINPRGFAEFAASVLESPESQYHETITNLCDCLFENRGYFDKKSQAFVSKEKRQLFIEKLERKFY